MGALFSCCKGGHGVVEENQLEMPEAKRKTGLAAKQRVTRRRVGKKVETEEDRAKAADAKHKAGLAAQRRQEAFDKSPVGRAARKAVADSAKPLPPPNQRGEPALRWQMG